MNLGVLFFQGFGAARTKRVIADLQSKTLNGDKPGKRAVAGRCKRPDVISNGIFCSTPTHQKSDAFATRSKPHGG